jgi:hypothetical protein
MGALLCQDMTVSAGEDDREPREPTTDFAAQRDPIHPWHHHIAEDQVKLARLFLKQL